MLLGEHEHTIDDKNRLTLPARFRNAFAEGVVLTRGMDGCLYAYRRDDWEILVESRLAELDPLSVEGRRMQRFFFSGAVEAELDKQGRVMIPAALIKHGGLGRDVDGRLAEDLAGPVGPAGDPGVHEVMRARDRGPADQLSDPLGEVGRASCRERVYHPV